PRLKTCKKARSGRLPSQPGPSSSERRSRFKSRTAVASKRMDSQMGIPNFIGKDHCLALTNGNGKGCRRIDHLTQQRLEKFIKRVGKSASLAGLQPRIAMKNSCLRL